MNFLAKAAKHWTAERVQKVTGDKQLLITPATAPELLRVLGLLNDDASMSADAVRKFRQINHMLALVVPEVTSLAKTLQPLRVVDYACGTSYLSLLLAWYLREQNLRAEIIGVDCNPKVIATSKERATRLALTDSLKFHCGSVTGQDWSTLHGELFSRQDEVATRPHVVLALHACDTATDQALAFGISLKSDYLAVAPCCQGELARQWKDRTELNHPFGPVFRSPHFRRQVAAEMTDVLRMLLTLAHGYEVTATEFVPLAHSHKNRLLTAIRRGRFQRDAEQQYQALKTSLGGPQISLERLLQH